MKTKLSTIIDSDLLYQLKRTALENDLRVNSILEDALRLYFDTKVNCKTDFSIYQLTFTGIE
jgi:hypothetical protein